MAFAPTISGWVQCWVAGVTLWFIESKAGHFAGLITVNTTNRFLPAAAALENKATTAASLTN